MASTPRLGIPLLLALPILLAGCFLSFSPSGDSGATVTEGPVVPSEPGGDRFPDVLEVRLEPSGERTFDVRVTLSSPYDTPERYADGWRVLDPEGNVLGSHTLLHDHATSSRSRVCSAASSSLTASMRSPSRVATRRMASGASP